MSWGNVWTSVFGSVKPFITQFFYPIIMLILVIVLIKSIAQAAMNYRRGDEIAWMPIFVVVVIAVIVTALLGGSDPLAFSLFGIA